MGHFRAKSSHGDTLALVARQKKRKRAVSARPLGALARISEERAQHDAALRGLIREAAAEGATAATVAASVGVSRATLYRRFGAELRDGRSSS
jgi:AcrR family transcriptional regulator